MKRSRALLRKLLEFAEARNSTAFVPPPELPCYTPEQIHYHVGLCKQAGFLVAEDMTSSADEFQVYRMGPLTWAGHECGPDSVSTGVVRVVRQPCAGAPLADASSPR